MKGFRVTAILSDVQQRRECEEACHQITHALSGYTATQAFTSAMNCSAIYAHHREMTREKFLQASLAMYDFYYEKILEQQREYPENFPGHLEGGAKT